jgi:hypothetical protein
MLAREAIRLGQMVRIRLDLKLRLRMLNLRREKYNSAVRVFGCYLGNVLKDRNIAGQG